MGPTLLSRALALLHPRDDVTTPLPHTALLVLSFATVSFFVFVSATQAFLLVGVYAVPGQTLGAVTASLALADEMTNLVSTPFWGFASDRVGRRAVVASGFAIVAASLFAMPWGARWSPDLILVRIVFAFGSSALSSMLTAILADITKPNGVPRVSAGMGIMSGLGALTAAFGYLRIGATACLRTTYAAVAGICIGMGVVTVCTLRHDYHKRRASTRTTLRSVPTAVRRLWTDPDTFLAMVSSFTARAASSAAATYVSLWIVRYMTGTPACPASSGAPSNSTSTSFCGLSDTRCPAAVGRASSVSGIVQTLALVSAIFVGLATERARHPRDAALVAAVLVAVCYGVVATSTDPTKNSAYGLAVGLGVAEIASIITAQVLLVHRMPQDLRGALSGMYALSGSLGVITVAELGGQYFDAGSLTAPFSVTAVIGAVQAAVAIALVARRCTGRGADADEPVEWVAVPESGESQSQADADGVAGDARKESQEVKVVAP